MKIKVERKYDEKVSFEVGSIVSYTDVPDLVIMVIYDNDGDDSFDGVIFSGDSNYTVGQLVSRMVKSDAIQFHGTITIEV